MKQRKIEINTYRLLEKGKEERKKKERKKEKQKDRKD